MVVNDSTRWYRLGAYVTALALVVLSSWPRLAFNPLHISNVDKLQHFTIYAVLAFFVFHGWVVPRLRTGSRITPWMILILLITFAGVDEYHQKWIAGRIPELADFIADSLGVCAGFGIAYLQERYIQLRRSKSPS
jgi:VanZ family protein